MGDLAAVISEAFRHRAGYAGRSRFVSSLRKWVGAPVVNGMLVKEARPSARSPGFRLHTPLDTPQLGAVTLLSIDRLDSRTLERESREGTVKYRQVGPLEGMRVSPHIYVLEEELDHFVEVLEGVVLNSRRRFEPGPFILEHSNWAAT